MDRKKAALIAGLTVLLAVLVFLFFHSGGRERLKESEGQGASSSEAKTPPDRATKTVRLYFPREEDGLLVPEERQIVADPSLAREAEEVLAELISGPRGDFLPSLPAETKVGRVFVLKDGTAYVDFTRDIAEKHPSGTEAEMITIFAVVNSLTVNFTSIKKVFILIDGEERETLNGHLSLDRPFLPDYSLIAKR